MLRRIKAFQAGEPIMMLAGGPVPFGPLCSWIEDGHWNTSCNKTAHAAGPVA
jgi:hypothetical protein